MATNLSSTTFLSEYNDDYRDSDHYHRILFNNGKALQARELTQMQSIIQSEMARIASFLFKEGGISGSAGSLSGAFAPVGSVRITDLPVGSAQLKGLELSNDAGVTATVKAVVDTGGSDDIVLVRYTSANNLLSSDPDEGPITFLASDTLSYDDGGSFSGSLVVKADDGATLAINKGSMVEIPAFNSFVAGHMVTTESQSLILSTTSSTPTTVIGFKLSEQIFTVNDAIALYDNSGSTPNLTSPGADRLKITLTLVRESDVSAGETFYPFIKIIDGFSRIVATSNNTLNEIGKILATRTDDITGDFIVANAPQGSFNLQIVDDSDANFLQYRVSGGIAFLNGNRIERGAANNPIRVAKPRGTTDKKTVSNEFIFARYGNYFLADSLNGLISSLDSFAELNLFNGATLGGTNIGTARIRQIEEVDSKFRLHMFDVNMDSSAGVPYNLRAAKSVGLSPAHYANLAEVDGIIQLQDKSQNSLLFPLPSNRVNQIDTVELTVQRIDRRTTSGAGAATFQVSSAASSFEDTANWIVQVDSSGQIFSPPTVSGTPVTTATVTGLPSGSAVTLLGYEKITNAQRKTKTLATSGATQSVNVSESVTPDSTGRFKLSKADIYRFTSVVDDTITASADSANPILADSADITYKFIFDGGQRDDYYDVGQGILRKDQTAPAGSITVTYDYFYHTVGAFFGGVRSYPDLSYDKIPTYITDYGKQYKLSDVIDMRPVKSPSNNFTSTGAVIEPLPRNTDFMIADTVEYWMPRVDVVTLSPTGNIKTVAGVASDTPSAPSTSSEDMILHYVMLEPYTITSKETRVDTVDHRGLKMTDLRQMEKRVSNLEAVSSLTAAEFTLNNIEIADPNDGTLPARVKLGITGDTFNSNIQSAIADNDYRARIDKPLGMIAPRFFSRTLPMWYDSDYSVGVIRKGNTIWPTYVETVMINHSVASKAINVNQFELNKYVGSGVIDPPIINWNVRKLVDPNNTGGVAVGTDDTQISGQGSQSFEGDGA